MLRGKSICPLRMFFMSCLSSIFSQWVPLPNPRFIDLEWYKNIFGNNTTNYIKATYTADNTVNLHSKNCNFLLSRSLLFSICCSLILENGNFYTYNDKFILQKWGQILGLLVEVHVMSWYSSQSVKHFQVIKASVIQNNTTNICEFITIH